MDTTIVAGMTDTISFNPAVFVYENTKTPKPKYYLNFSPSPFNSALSISTPDDATVEIFDIQGKHIAELPGGNIVWEPNKEIRSGIYLIRATFGNRTITKRAILIR